MSKTGRQLIDRVKQSIGKYVKLPVPPYERATYWEGVYASLGPDDTFEWGRVSYRDLASYQYQMVFQLDYNGNTTSAVDNASATAAPPTITTTLGETLQVHPHAHKDEPILIVGSGNSSLGYDMHQDGYRGPLLHVDVSSRVIQTMALKWQDLQRTGDMQFLEDDATLLSSLQDQQVAAAIDKGLVDALFCVDQYSQCAEVMQAVHRVLQPSGVFCILSFSKPQYLLPALEIPKKRTKQQQWSSVETRELGNIYLYRFQKAVPHSYAGGDMRPSNVKLSFHKRRRQ